MDAYGWEEGSILLLTQDVPADHPKWKTIGKKYSALYHVQEGNTRTQAAWLSDRISYILARVIELPEGTNNHLSVFFPAYLVLINTYDTIYLVPTLRICC